MRLFLGRGEPLPSRYGRWVVRWRWLVLLASVSWAGGLGVFATWQHFYNPSEIWFLPDDPDLASYRALTRQFGRDDFVVVAFRDPEGIFTNRALTAVADLTDRLEVLPFVDRVDSLTNYQHVQSARRPSGEEEVSISDLVRRSELPLSAVALARRRDIALSEDLLVGSLLSARDGDGRPATTTAVVARVTPDSEKPDQVVEVVESILREARQVETAHGYRLYVTGVPVVEHGFMSNGRREMFRFTAILAAVVTGLLLVVFRRAEGVVLPTAVAALAIAPALGVMALAGMWLNALTTVIPPVLLTVAMAESIHIVSTYLGLRRRGRPHEAAVVAAVARTLRPCVTTSVTTAIGFASLLGTTVVPMRQMGFGACLGVVFALIQSFTLVPALLAIWPQGRWQMPANSPGHGGSAGGFFERTLDGVLDVCGRLATNRPRQIVAGATIGFLLLSAFIWRIPVETSYRNMFKPETTLRQGLAFIERHLSGSVDIEIAVDSGRADGVHAPAFLDTLRQLQAFLRSQPEVSHTVSVADIVTRMHRVMHADGASLPLPDSREAVAQYLLLYTLGSNRSDLKDRVDVDNRWARVSARARVHSSADTQALAGRIRAFMVDRFPDLRVNVTGKALLYTSLQDEMANNTITAFATALIPITLAQALLFWSIRVGILSIIPNVLPILATGGMMGLLRIPLDPGSAMVGGVAIGIVVDDTVHFFAAYCANRDAGHDANTSARSTLRDVGPAAMYTTFVLAIGFSVFAFSSFNFIAYFGQLVAFVIVLALAADLLMTPALLVLCDRWMLKRLATQASASATPQKTLQKS